MSTHLLIGDSVGMVLHGMDDTLGVTLDMMVMHTEAVKRGSTRAAIIADLPFGTYQASPRQAFDAAARLLAAGAQAVKLEGGRAMAENDRVPRRTRHSGHGPCWSDAAVAAHDGGFRVQGRDEAAAERIIEDARAIADAGAFSVVIEGGDGTAGAPHHETIAIPTIGIGASADCDGQVLVTDDILGLTGDATPRFVQRYADLAGIIDGSGVAIPPTTSAPGAFRVRHSVARSAASRRRSVQVCSSVTSTCPSQSADAPMRWWEWRWFSVMRRASGSITPSITTLKGTGIGDGACIFDDPFGGGFVAPLDAETAHRVQRLRRQTNMAHDRNAAFDEERGRFCHGATAFQLSPPARRRRANVLRASKAWRGEA